MSARFDCIYVGTQVGGRNKHDGFLVLSKFCEPLTQPFKVRHENCILLLSIVPNDM